MNYQGGGTLNLKLSQPFALTPNDWRALFLALTSLQTGTQPHSDSRTALSNCWTSNRNILLQRLKQPIPVEWTAWPFLRSAASWSVEAATSRSHSGNYQPNKTWI